MKNGSERSFSQPFSLAIVTVLSTLLLSAFSQAQVTADEAATAPEATSESGQVSSTVKFRGFRNATEDLPFMSDDWKVSFFQLATVEADRLDDHNTPSWFSITIFH